jgi:sensor domain CHASE-containing protein
MKLRAKTLLGIALALTILISGLFVYSKMTLTRGFNDVEWREAKLNTQRSIDAIHSLVDNLENKMIDWAAWDDPYNWMQDHNTKFVESNLSDSSVQAMKIDMWAWIDENRNITFGRLYNGDQAVDLTPDILQFIKTNQSIYQTGNEGGWKNINGFVNFSHNPMYITAQPIITSERKGPRRGVSLTGRWLNEDAVLKLSKMTHLETTIKRGVTEQDSPDWEQVSQQLLTGGEAQSVVVRELSDTKMS